MIKRKRITVIFFLISLFSLFEAALATDQFIGLPPSPTWKNNVPEAPTWRQGEIKRNEHGEIVLVSANEKTDKSPVLNNFKKITQ